MENTTNEILDDLNLAVRTMKKTADGLGACVELGQEALRQWKDSIDLQYAEIESLQAEYLFQFLGPKSQK